MDAIGIAPAFHGTSVHDGLGSYQGYSFTQALCNVHHLRELTFIEEECKQPWARRMKDLLLEMKSEVETARTLGKSELDLLDLTKHLNFRTFDLAFPSEAQELDALLFQQSLSELLVEPVNRLYALVNQRLEPPLTCEALASSAYGMLQILLWHDQVGLKPALPKEMWVLAGGIAQEAKSALGLAGKAQQDWIDTVIRIEAVLGWATLMLGQLDQAIGHFLYLIGWYSAAKERSYRTVLRNRE